MTSIRSGRTINGAVVFFIMAMIVTVSLARLPSQGGGHGPQIKVLANGEPFLGQTLRDNEMVSQEQLGGVLVAAYLQR